MQFLKKYLIGLAVVDVIWAILLATFGGSLLAELGIDTVSAGAGWIALFFAGLFQGAIFLVVFSVFGGIMAFVASKAPPIVGKAMLTGVGIAAAWGVIFATFLNGVFDRVTTVNGIDSVFSGVLFWIISFVAAFFQGLIFLVVISGFIGIGLFLFAVLRNQDKGGRPNLSDRNPGEPPHR